MTPNRKRIAILDRLRDQLAACGCPAEDVDRSLIRTDYPVLDRLLPAGGLRRGSIVELLDPGPGGGAETVAAVLTRVACRSPGVVVVVDRDGQFYPPALAAWDVPWERLVVVRAETDA